MVPFSLLHRSEREGETGECTRENMVISEIRVISRRRIARWKMKRRRVHANGAGWKEKGIKFRVISGKDDFELFTRMQDNSGLNFRVRVGFSFFLLSCFLVF